MVIPSESTCPGGSKYVWQRGVESLQGRVTAARSWPLFREKKNHIGRCCKKLGGHNFDLRAKSSWEKTQNSSHCFPLSNRWEQDKKEIRIQIRNLFTWSCFFLILIFSFPRPSFPNPKSILFFWDQFFRNRNFSRRPNFAKPKQRLFFQDQIFWNQNWDIFFETKFSETDTFSPPRPNSPKPKPKPSKNCQKSRNREVSKSKCQSLLLRGPDLGKTRLNSWPLRLKLAGSSGEEINSKQIHHC